MAKQQSASTLNTILSGQWSKSEKRVKLARDIREANAQAHRAIKLVKRNQLV